MTQEPLIYTSKGNLPMSGLDYRHRWIDNDNETTFVEEYWQGDECVKRSVHTMLKQGLDLTAVAANLG